MVSFCLHKLPTPPSKFDSIFISEPWCDESVCEGLLLCYHNDYSVLRCDRPTYGGGVCIFMNTSKLCTNSSSK